MVARLRLTLILLISSVFLVGAANVAFAQGTYFISGPGPLRTPVSLGATGDARPYNGFVLGSDGNYYGTTYFGGVYGNGAILRLDPRTNAITTVWSFGRLPTDPANPVGALILGRDGNLYGTTFYGGIPSTSYDGFYAAGTIFTFNGSSLTTLYSFTGGADGANPFGGLVEGSDGSFYGTAAYGGTNDSGTVFRCTVVAGVCAAGVDGLLVPLYRFSGGTDGANPFGGLVEGANGTFYGTTAYGGTDPLNGAGTLFKCTVVAGLCDTTGGSGGLLTPAHTFLGGADGSTPFAQLIRGSDGNFYGTTVYGGNNDHGTIYKFDGVSTLTTLYRFSSGAGGADGADGAHPFASLIQGIDGSFYGTADSGGLAAGLGTVFRCTIGGGGLCSTTGGLLALVFTFHGFDGDGPFGGVVQASDGTFYGMTQYGGAFGVGSVFYLTPKFASTVSVTGGSFTYDGLAHPALATASSADSASLAPVTVTYNGLSTVPVNVGTGTYAVLASFAGDEYNLPSSATGNIFMTKAQSVVTIANQTFTYNGLAHPATATATGGAAGVLLTPVTFTYNGVATVPVNGGTYAVVASYAGDGNNLGSSAPATLTINKATPTVTWATPAAITYGTTLSATQLNATASVPGSFVYSPGTRTLLGAGTRTLSVTFTPTNTTNYNTVTQTVTLVVNQATPTITWNTPAAITYGTVLSATQLNATASVAGTFVYAPPAGTLLTAGSQPLLATFTPTDAANYATVTKTVTLTVNKVTPTVTWNAPAAIAYPTALGGTQLNATASAPGALVYTPAAGTVLNAGPHTLSVTFTPTDTTDYNSVTRTVALTVTKGTPTVTWATPAPIIYGTALSAAQLNATASVPGTLVYTPAAGTVLSAGTQTLSVAFTPTDTANYVNVTKTVSLTVNKVTTTITLTGGTFTYDGLPHAAVVSALGVGGIQLPVTVTYNGLATIPLGAGTYAVVATFAGDANNAPATATATVVISPVPLTITANDASRNYGAPNPSFTASYAGFVHGETAAALLGTLTLTTPATTTSAPGTYTITPGGVFSTNYTITFVPGSLTVVNVALLAVNDAVSTQPGTPVTIQVLANDTQPSGGLTITAVTSPSNGTAVIVAGSAILYTPATGFTGTDTFAYTVTDIVGATGSATVTVSVGGVGRFVVMSDDFTWLRAGATIVSGDVGANLRRQHRHGHGADFDDGDSDDITVRLGANATMLQPSSRVVGDTVALDRRSSIYNLVDNFLISHGGAILGDRINTMQVPFVTLPAFPVIAAGRQNITVARNKTLTLPAGSYGKVHVSNGATLTLTGGLYQIASLDVDQSATVLFAAAVELRIADDLDADASSQLIVGPGMRASQAVIYVGGDDDNRSNRRDDSFDGDNGGEVVVNIGENAVVQANIYAQNGSVWLKSKTQATGAFIGHHVRVGQGARLTLDSAF
jgi:uncharacterized repeat protein (TIGR03803 family)